MNLDSSSEVLPISEQSTGRDCVAMEESEPNDEKSGTSKLAIVPEGRPPLTDISKRGDGKTASTVQPSDEYGSETTSVCPFKERGEINCVKSQPMEPNYVNDFESENAKPPRPRRMSLPNIEINTDFLKEIAEELTGWDYDWKMLACELELGAERICTIEKNCKKESDRNFKVLTSWREIVLRSCGTGYSNQLCQVLKDLNFQNIAKLVPKCQHIHVPQHAETGPASSRSEKKLTLSMLSKAAKSLCTKPWDVFKHKLFIDREGIKEIEAKYSLENEVPFTRFFWALVKWNECNSRKCHDFGLLLDRLGHGALATEILGTPVYPTKTHETQTDYVGEGQLSDNFSKLKLNADHAADEPEVNVLPRRIEGDIRELIQERGLRSAEEAKKFAKKLYRQILEVATQEANKGNRDEVKQHFSKGQACVPFKELADIRRAVAGTLFDGQQGTCFFASWNDKTYIFTCVHNVVKRFNGMDRFRNMTEEEQRKLLQTALEKLYIIFPDKSGKLPSRPKDDEKFGIPFDKFVFDVSDEKDILALQFDESKSNAILKKHGVNVVPLQEVKKGVLIVGQYMSIIHCPGAVRNETSVEYSIGEIEPPHDHRDHEDLDYYMEPIPEGTSIIYYNAETLSGSSGGPVIFNYGGKQQNEKCLIIGVHRGCGWADKRASFLPTFLKQL